jgi:perosamine synthetase
MIPLFKVHYPQGVGQRIEDVFASGMITEGEVSDRFEAEFAALVGNPYTALVNSCTSALVLAYRMCGVGPGTEVISSPMTCMATNEPIVNAGADIVWADIEHDTGNIDPKCLEKLITPRTRAIVAVHWAGQPFNIDDVCSIARKHGVPVIGDAAHALGATYNNKPIATFCDYTVFSFQAIKHLTTGDGGAISCRGKLDFERLKLLRWFGIDRKYPGSKWQQDILECGYKFHMNNLTAAIGLEQMKHIKKIIHAHMSHGMAYDAGIIDRHSVRKLHRPADMQSAHWIYSLLVDDPVRFKEHMSSRGVATDVVHVRNDHYTVFNRFRRDDLFGCNMFCPRLINIPVGWWLTDDDVKYIIEAVNAY